MKYMLLVHHNEESFRKRPELERQQMIQESVQLAQQLHASGHYLGAAPLHQLRRRLVFEFRDGKPTVTDGPSQKHANSWRLLPRQSHGSRRGDLHRCTNSGARIGTVEIRPVTEVTGLPGE